MPKHDAINRLTSRTFQYLLPSLGFLEPLQVQGGGCRETPDGKQNIATGETSQSHHFTPFLFTSFHFYVFSNFFGSYQLKGKYNTQLHIRLGAQSFEHANVRIFWELFVEKFPVNTIHLYEYWLHFLLYDGNLEIFAMQKPSFAICSNQVLSSFCKRFRLCQLSLVSSDWALEIGNCVIFEFLHQGRQSTSGYNSHQNF